jgi:hypothetical protein
MPPGPVKRERPQVDGRHAVRSVEKVGGCARDEDLTAVGRGTDPGRAVDLDPRVPVRRPQRGAGMDADPRPEVDALGPAPRAQRPLDLDRRGGSALRRRERAEGAVALEVDDSASVRGNRVREHGAERIEDELGIGVAEQSDDGRRPVDVGKEKRDRPSGKSWDAVRLP